MREQGKNIDTIVKPGEPSPMGDSKPAAASGGRIVTYFNPDTDHTMEFTAPPEDFEALLAQIGESRGIFTYQHEGDDSFIHD